MTPLDIIHPRNTIDNKFVFADRRLVFHNKFSLALKFFDIGVSFGASLTQPLCRFPELLDGQ
jgi:hypothetical protein